MITILKSRLDRTGGLEKYTWQIARAFHAQGVPVTLLTTGNPPPSDFEVRTFPIDHPISWLNVVDFDRACTSYLKEHPARVVFGLDRNRFQTHIRAGNGTHAAYLRHRAREEGWLKTFSFQLNPLHRLLLKLEKQAFEHPELQVLFTNSHMVRTEILSHYRIDADKVRVVHNGVEWTSLAPDFNSWAVQRPEVTRTLSLDPNCYQFLFIGHNYQRKGLDKLLHALALLPDKNFQLSVVGKEKNLAAFQHLAEKLQIAQQVRFFGPRPDIRSFYQLADCLIVPSLYDPFANVTVEALAMGLFVISSPYNGGHEVLSPLNGVVLPSLAPDALAEALSEAMGHPKTPARAEAIRNSVRHLDFPNQLEQIVHATL